MCTRNRSMLILAAAIFAVSLVFTTKTYAIPLYVQDSVNKPVNPRGTWLFVNANPAHPEEPFFEPADSKVGPSSIPLFPKFLPGDFLYIETLGAYCFSCGFGNPGTDNGMIGLFQGQSGPIDTGTDVVTHPTNVNKIPTDIPADFRISPWTIVRVPEAADILSFSADDSFFSDNTSLGFAAALGCVGICKRDTKALAGEISTALDHVSLLSGLIATRLSATSLVERTVLLSIDLALSSVALNSEAVSRFELSRAGYGFLEDLAKAVKLGGKIPDPSAWSLYLSGVSILTNLASLGLSMYADDPPRMDYNVLSLPSTEPLPDFAMFEMNPVVAQQMNQTFSSIIRLQEAISLAVLAYERFQGAVAAGDVAAADMQIRAFEDLMSVYYEAAQEVNTGLRQAPELMASMGIEDSDYRSGELEQAIAEIMSEGFPDEALTLFLELGLTTDDIEALLLSLDDFDTSTMSGSLFDSLFDLTALYGQAAVNTHRINQQQVSEPSTLVLLMGGCIALWFWSALIYPTHSNFGHRRFLEQGGIAFVFACWGHCRYPRTIGGNMARV